MVDFGEFGGRDGLVGRSVWEIETPALVVDLTIMERNMDRMSSFLAKGSVGLRPHFKTHKTGEIAKMQMERGALGITCAKLGEAEAAALAGIPDIMVANQIVGQAKTNRAAELSKQTRLSVACDCDENIRDLSAASAAVGGDVGVVIEVEVGMGRAGVRSAPDAVHLARLAHELPGVHFRGIMGYEGHAVFVGDIETRGEEARKCYSRLLGVRDVLEQNGYPPGIVSAAGTGTYMMAGRTEGLTDIEAGSYVFMDMRYATVEGVNFDQSLALLATITSHPEPDLYITDAGMKTMSAEFGVVGTLPSYGLQVTGMSEEHVKLAPGGHPGGRLREFDRKYGADPGTGFGLGDKIFLIPSHSCTTVNLHDHLYAVRDGIVEAVWRVSGRGRSY